MAIKDPDLGPGPQVAVQDRARRTPLVASPDGPEPLSQEFHGPTAFQDQDFGDYGIVELQPLAKHVVPLFKALVVYLGRRPHTSLAMVGKVLSTMEGDEEVRGIDPDGGIQCYDFALYDSAGKQQRPERVDGQPTGRIQPTVRLLSVGQARAVGDAKLAGKPYQVVEHGEHLRQMLRGTENGELAFRVLVINNHRAAFNEYVMRRERLESRQRDYEDELITSTGRR